MYHSGKHTFRYTVMGARVDCIDEEVLKNLQDTNCKSLWFGIESGSDRILNQIGKSFTVAEAEERLRLASRYISQVVGSFIVGFPFEDYRDFEQTCDFSQRLYGHGADVFINFLRPQNGTRIYRVYSGLLKYLDSDLVISPQPLTDAEKDRIKSNSEIYSWYHTYETPNLAEKMSALKRLKEGQPLRTDERKKLLEG